MTAIAKTVNLQECPRLASWIENREGFLSAYIDELRKAIPRLLAVQANMEGPEPSEDFKATGDAARLMGCLANDLDIIHREIFQ